MIIRKADFPEGNSDRNGVALAHQIFGVMAAAAAVLQFGFVLVCVDQLTQVAEVSNDWTNKLCSCRDNDATVYVPTVKLLMTRTDLTCLFRRHDFWRLFHGQKSAL